MTKVKEFGVGFENLHARDFVRNAKLAEDLGFGAWWVPEDYFYRGAFSLAAAAAAATSRIKIGIGVLNPYTRHPALTAMEFGALDEISEGRAILGLGAGLKDWIEGRLRIPYTRPTTAMREAIDIVRAMFRGETVSYQGRVFNTDGVKFNFAPRRSEIPIHLGVLGPRNLELAGEVADGVLLSVMTSPAYLEFAGKHIRRGLEKSGRNRADFRLGGYQILSISENEQEARDRVKPLLAMLIGLMAPQPEVPILPSAGLEPETIRAFGASLGRGEMPVAMVTDWMIDRFTIAGRPARCRENLSRLVEAGLDSPVFFELPGVPAEQLIRDVHVHLMPHFL
ncbi:MAG: LLM class flavin-dependent oxidoreductase [Candidatus Binataceae bacterium]